VFCATLVLSLRAGADEARKAADPKKTASMADQIIPPHFHPAEEDVTVLQGAFWMGMGDKFDEGALKEMPAGAFHAIPKGVHHYGMAKGRTVIQLHGFGPWGITYVNPSDDPRKKAAEK